MADSEPASAPPAAALPSAPPTLGEMLRSARLAHDLTLEQLSTELRIEAKQLKALEENRFEQIGVPVFVKGYLKQYGLRLGLDVRDLLALYYKQTTLADVQVQPSRSIKLRDDRQVTSWVLAAIVLLIVIAALAVWWWNGGSFSAIPLTRSTPPATTSAPAPAAAEPQARTALQPVEQSAVPAAEPSAPPADQPAPLATDAPASSDSVPAVVPPALVELADGDDDGRAAPVTAIPLEFVFAEEGWAEVTDARGERLLFGLNAAGRRVTVRGEPPFAVVLGNADAVQLTVDGEPYAIPAARQDDLARFSVDIAEE
jgi:cytoskeleton protein RodZ